jgi:hypothetical protein
MLSITKIFENVTPTNYKSISMHPALKVLNKLIKRIKTKQPTQPSPIGKI